MARKKRLAGIIAVCVLVLIFIAALCAVLYAAESFPAFNAAVDSLFPFISRNSVAVSESSAADVPSEPAGARIAALVPSFAASAVPNFADTAASGTAAGFTISADGYVLRSSENGWSYGNRYPIVSKPGAFADAVVFIDASRTLVCLDLVTGVLVREAACPVYPAGAAYADGASYVFEAAAGGWYAAYFGLSDAETAASGTAGSNFADTAAPGTAGSNFADTAAPGTAGSNFADTAAPGTAASPEFPSVHGTAAQPVAGFDQALHESFMPDSAVLAGITAKLNGLISAEPPQPVPGDFTYTETDGVRRFDRGVFSPLIVFSPAEQGVYTFGLCSADGAWIKDTAFVAVFTGTGEMRSVSLDYVADRPQITMHLSDAEMYYVCAGFMNNVPASTAEDTAAADLPEVPAYFQVKKAP